MLITGVLLCGGAGVPSQEYSLSLSEGITLHASNDERAAVAYTSRPDAIGAAGEPSVGLVHNLTGGGMAGTASNCGALPPNPLGSRPQHLQRHQIYKFVAALVPFVLPAGYCVSNHTKTPSWNVNVGGLPLDGGLRRGVLLLHLPTSHSESTASTYIQFDGDDPTVSVDAIVERGKRSYQ